jgi:hypothetical protein
VRNVTCPVIKDERRFDGGQRDGHAMMIAQRGRFTAGRLMMAAETNPEDRDFSA